jgi:hypothetical protein
MLYFDNPGHRGQKPCPVDTARESSHLPRRKTKRSASDPARSRHPSELQAMAGRKRARRRKDGRFVKSGASSNPHKRRRRKRHAATRVARRRHAAATNPPRHHRRRARRNPPLMGRGSAIGHALSGAVNGVSVAGGQLLARKIRGAAQGVLPATVNVSKGLSGVATTSAAALLVSWITAMFAPAKYRRAGEFIIAGAWSEAINMALAQTPAAPYLSAFSPRRFPSGVAAWPARRVGVAAWPASLPRSSGRVAAWPMRMAGVSATGTGITGY